MMGNIRVLLWCSKKSVALGMAMEADAINSPGCVLVSAKGAVLRWPAEECGAAYHIIAKRLEGRVYISSHSLRPNICL